MRDSEALEFRDMMGIFCLRTGSDMMKRKQGCKAVNVDSNDNTSHMKRRFFTSSPMPLTTV